MQIVVIILWEFKIIIKSTIKCTLLLNIKLLYGSIVLIKMIGEKMKKIYVLLMHTHTIPAKLIKFATKFEYSHVGISLDKKCDKIYSFGRRKFNSILNSGFCIENKDGEFFRKFNKTRCKIFEISISNEQYNDLKNILDMMKENMDNYKYDFLGIIPRFCGIPITFKNKYVCSYFVAAVLEKANICKFSKKVYFVKPKDFENLEGFKEIYKGSYNTYNKNN